MSAILRPVSNLEAEIVDPAQTQSSQQRSDLDETARSLEATGDYKILRRLVPRRAMGVPAGYTGKLGVIVDLETTGLDFAKAEVIELGMTKFCYSARDEITLLAETFQSFNQPSRPIPAEVTQLTGITDDMVQGHRIDAAAVKLFVADANIVIAHNAAFDRGLCGAALPDLCTETLGLLHGRNRLAEIPLRRQIAGLVPNCPRQFDDRGLAFGDGVETAHGLSLNARRKHRKTVPGSP
jgi:DNA polymerase III epsilon subunit-like protein